MKVADDRIQINYKKPLEYFYSISSYSKTESGNQLKSSLTGRSGSFVFDKDDNSKNCFTKHLTTLNSNLQVFTYLHQFPNTRTIIQPYERKNNCQAIALVGSASETYDHVGWKTLLEIIYSKALLKAEQSNTRLKAMSSLVFSVFKDGDSISFLSSCSNF